MLIVWTWVICVSINLMVFTIIVSYLIKDDFDIKNSDDQTFIIAGVGLSVVLGPFLSILGLGYLLLIGICELVYRLAKTLSKIEISVGKKENV